MKMDRIPTILIVDDHQNDQELVKTLFKRSFGGYIYTAFSIAEAEKHLQGVRFDVISLDGDMGLEYGYNLIPSIKKLQKHDPVIMMVSGNSRSIKIGIANGAHYAFDKHEIAKEVKLNEEFELVPIRQSLSA